MKVSDLTEQLQRRKSPEELAAMKAAPDYWKKGIRKELNDIINTFGAVSRETGRSDDVNTLNFERSVSVLVSGANSLTLHRDKRAKALVHAISKWLAGKIKQGYKVGIGIWGFKGRVESAVRITDSVEDISDQLARSIKLEDTLGWLRQLGERGEKLPVRFDLRMVLVKPPTP